MFHSTLADPDYQEKIQAYLGTNCSNNPLPPQCDNYHPGLVSTQHWYDTYNQNLTENIILDYQMVNVMSPSIPI